MVRYKALSSYVLILWMVLHNPNSSIILNPVMTLRKDYQFSLIIFRFSLSKKMLIIPLLLSLCWKKRFSFILLMKTMYSRVIWIDLSKHVFYLDNLRLLFNTTMIILLKGLKNCVAMFSPILITKSSISVPIGYTLWCVFPDLCLNGLILHAIHLVPVPTQLVLISLCYLP